MLSHTPTQTLVVDTGPLLIHAFLAFGEGRYIQRVSGNVPTQDAVYVGRFIDEDLFSGARRIIVTPMVISEFQALAQSLTGFDRDYRAMFLREYSQRLIHLEYVSPAFDELVRIKEERDLWRLSFTDTSLVLVAQERRATVLSMDLELIGRCTSMGILALHPYHLYLEAS
ncbi:MAG: hypothetical protein HY681_04495 [Chloroflexi bacterium]|nr:hypothetical protein [Chloroflexota bacterium]